MQKFAVLFRDGKVSVRPITKAEEEFMAEISAKGFTVVAVHDTPTGAKEMMAGYVADGYPEESMMLSKALFWGVALAAAFALAKLCGW